MHYYKKAGSAEHMRPQDDNNKTDHVLSQQQSAADLIRNKLETLYAKEEGHEPDAKEELAETESIPASKRSKHQEYMHNLSNSGRSLAEIQTAWHEYYSKLTDREKHEVWKEFYEQHEKVKKNSHEHHSQPSGKSITDNKSDRADNGNSASKNSGSNNDSSEEFKPDPIPVSYNTAAAKRRKRKKREVAVADLKQQLISQVESRAKVSQNPHARALGFGLTMGFLTMFVLLFGFFNERFVTPFIRPDANVSATPIIVDPNASGPVSAEPKIIIPKINVEAPVVYDIPSIQEKDVQKGLESGVVHYITTPQPGEKGNSVIFGHSSSNILNKGKYKFAFLMLKSLEKGDTFIIQKDGKRYVYRIYNEFVTSPDDFSVLGPTDKTASVTLITCDPPGTSTNRLIIQAEQIFPDPGTNAKSSAPDDPLESQPRELPSNSVSLWQRVTNIL